MNDFHEATAAPRRKHPAVLGAVFWLLTGDMVSYAGLVGGGLVLLLLNRPRRMMEG